MSESTLKEDILIALRKERNRLNAIKNPSREEDDRLSNCVEFIKRINQSSEQYPTELEVRNIWTGPLRL